MICFFFCLALLKTLPLITSPPPPPSLDFRFQVIYEKNDFNPLFHAELSIYQHFDTEWGVHFRAPKDDLQLAAAVVFQPDF